MVGAKGLVVRMRGAVDVEKKKWTMALASRTARATLAHAHSRIDRPPLPRAPAKALTGAPSVPHLTLSSHHQTLYP